MNAVRSSRFERSKRFFASKTVVLGGADRPHAAIGVAPRTDIQTVPTASSFAVARIGRECRVVIIRIPLELGRWSPCGANLYTGRVLIDGRYSIGSSLVDKRGEESGLDLVCRVQLSVNGIREQQASRNKKQGTP